MILTKKDVQFLNAAMGDNESRKSLMTMNIKVNNGKALIRTANAYIIRQIIKDTDLPFGEYSLERDTCLNIQKMMKPKSRLTFYKDCVTVDTCNMSLPLTEPKYEYPNLDGLMNVEQYGEKPDFTVIGLDAVLLTKALSYTPDRIVKFSFKSMDKIKRYCESPILMEYYGEFCDYLTLIMPVRIEW